MRPNAVGTEVIQFRAHLRFFAKVSAAMDKVLRDRVFAQGRRQKSATVRSGLSRDYELPESGRSTPKLANGQPLDTTNKTGSATFTVVVEDKAGNTATLTVNYRIK
jgi:hypothetical protein